MEKILEEFWSEEVNVLTVILSFWKWHLNDPYEPIYCFKIWLPKNMTWSDLSAGSHGVNHTEFRELIWTIPMTIFIIILRGLVEKYVICGKFVFFSSETDVCYHPNPNLLMVQSSISICLFFSIYICISMIITYEKSISTTLKNKLF